MTTVLLCLLLATRPGAPTRQASSLDHAAIAKLIEAGNLDEAETRLQRALARSPGDLRSRQQLARIRFLQDREAEAVTELRRVAAQGPLDRDLAIKLAAAELSEGRAAEAARQLRSAADRFHSVAALLQLAHLQSAQRDGPGALESLREARAIAPNSEEVLLNYAQLSLGARAPVPALLALEPLSRMWPTVAQYHYLFGVALMQVGDSESAVGALRRAEELEPNRPLTLIALGLVLNHRKVYAEAKPYLGRSLQLDPDSVDALAALAEAEDGLGELAQAEAHAQRALARAADNATANLVIGLVRLEQGRYEDARDALEKAVAAEPTSPRAHYQLSLAYARLNDPARSLEHLELYQRALEEAKERLEQAGKQTGLPVDRRHP